MKITHIAAGAGGMYCGACARDLALVRALIARGHDVQLLPLYTPLRDDGGGPVPTAPVRYGGINVLLQQASGLFRHVPLVDRVVDSPAVLRWVSRFTIETRAENLGPMTVSVLSGKDGRQQRELAKLLDVLEHEARPEVLSITNTLLSGIAPEAKARLGVPIFCSFQGEEHFVEQMPEPHRSEARRLMQANARAVDGFFSPGEAYAAKMAEFLDVPLGKIRVVRAGLPAGDYGADAGRPRRPFAIGYLSVITHGKGLDLLVDAFIRLAKGERRDVVLRVAGKVLNGPLWNTVRRRIAAEGLQERFEYQGEVSHSAKWAFFRQCSVFALPSRIPESRGMVVMEAMASGVPVVAPSSGVFPEMMALTGGGLLFPAKDPDGLADAIARVMDDPDAADRMGRAGAQGIARHFTAERAAEVVLDEYERALGGAVQPAGLQR